jgi:glycosyltransferase involved in cell wall biosynthesis
VRVAFVYPNPREELARAVAAGGAPDTGLLGQNHFAELGVEAFVHDSILRRNDSAGGPFDRMRWLARELTLPWELSGADVIVTPLATLLPLVARLRRRPRVLLLSYGTVVLWDRSGATRRALVRASLRAARTVVTISTASRGQILKRIELDPARVRFVPFGVDARFWQPTPPAVDGHVLAVGRDLARDYRTFGEALEGLPVRAVIVAKEENLRGVMLPSNVEVRMRISTDELRELYVGSRCVVVPMVPDDDPRGTESSGSTALLEAMACARATVVSERLSLEDYLYDDASLRVRAGDPEALRSALRRVIEDAPAAAAMGAAARRHVEERHTTRRFAEQLVELVEQVDAA